MSSPLSSAPEDGTATVAANDARRSSRVSRVPVKFSQATTQSAKRKRAQVDQQDLDDGIESDPDDHSDEAATRPAAPKKSTSGTTKPVARRSRKKAKNIDRADAANSTGLYAQVFATGGTIEDTISDWLELFETSEAQALADLINFALRCAGCDLEISAHDVADPDACTTKIADLQDEFQARNVTEYPIIAKSKGTSDFKTSLIDFFNALIKTTHTHGLLLDHVELIENMERWLTGMTAAQSRPFRHTATVISHAIVTAMCEIGRDLRAASAKSLRHGESENKSKNRNKGRVDAIRKEAADAQKHQELLDEIIEDWYNTVFIHRYRDIDPHIRVDCVAALGDWIVIYPDVMFDDNHLRYLGWLLSDNNATVRHEVAKQLYRMCKDGNRLVRLGTFTERFKARYVEMASFDTEVSVRIEAIKILEILRAGSFLEPDSIDIVGKLIFDAEPRVRHAVAPFFAESVNDAYDLSVEELGGEEVVDEELPEPTSTTLNLDWLRVKCLAEMLQEYNTNDADVTKTMTRHAFDDTGLRLHAALGESRFVVAAEALQSHMPVLEHCETIAGFLLYDSSTDGEGLQARLKDKLKLGSNEEIILAEILYMSIKHKISLADDETGDKHKRKRTKKQREDLAEEQESLQRQLSSLLPQLLKRYEDVPQITSIILRLDREVFDPDFEHDATIHGAFLNDVKKQFLMHIDDQVLDEASSALLKAMDSQDFGELAEEKIDELWDDLTSKLTILGKRDMSVRGNQSSSATVTLAKNVSRLRRLATISQAIEHLGSVDSDSPLDALIKFVHRGVRQGEKEDPAASRAEDTLALQSAGTVAFYFLWTTAGIIKTLAVPSGRLANDRLEAIATARDSYMTALVAVLDARRPKEPISASIAGHILDMHTTMATLRQIEARDDRGTDYLVLALEIDSEIADRILQIFTACESQYARLWHRTIEKDSKKRGAGGHPERAVDADPVDDDDDEEEATAPNHDEDPQSSFSDDDDDDDDVDLDPEDDDDDEEQGEASRSSRRQARQLGRKLLAEQRLCELSGKIVFALFAGMFAPRDATRVRKRLERNRLKLGTSYKAVVKLLDEMKSADSAVVRGSKGSGQGKGKKTTAVVEGSSGAGAESNGNRRVSERNVKSKAYVEVEEDDGDDDDDVVGEGEVEEEEEEVEDGEERENAERDTETDRDEGEDEIESIIGD